MHIPFFTENRITQYSLSKVQWSSHHYSGKNKYLCWNMIGVFWLRSIIDSVDALIIDRWDCGFHSVCEWSRKKAMPAPIKTQKRLQKYCHLFSFLFFLVWLKNSQRNWQFCGIRADLPWWRKNQGNLRQEYRNPRRTERD